MIFFLKIKTGILGFGLQYLILLSCGKNQNREIL